MLVVSKLLFLLFNLTFVVKCTRNPSVVIIGAGASGIAAATRLIKNGVNNITILEAENRIGGRIYSVKFGDAFVDLGAAWCHGERGNIVYDLAKDYNILQHFNLTKKLVYSDGSVIHDDFAQELYSFINKFITETADVETDKLSLGDIVLSEYESTIIQKYKNDSRKLEIAEATKDFFQRYTINMESAFDWFELSYRSDYKQCEGDYSQNWNGLGYKTILEIMMQKYPDPFLALPIDDKIVLSKKVNKIMWNDTSSYVKVLCNDGASYDADHVIWTPSLGVLKAQHKTLFEPQLPSKKELAISTIGFGAVMKVILQFSNAWWKDDKYYYGLVWSEKDQLTLSRQFFEGQVRDNISWINHLTFFHGAENNSNVLMLRFSGKMVPDIEKLSDQVIVDGCTFALKKFFGKLFNVTLPVSMIRSSWYSNPHFRGTYSFTTVKEREMGINLHKYLAEPLYNNNGKAAVLFAGEATNPDYFSTVHGAVESGFREADRILELYK